MQTQITILVDNLAGPRGTIGEHGFAAWISRDNTHTLFDTGGGQALSRNAQCLNKNFQDFHQLILSHGHWDHTGGLKHVLEQRQQTDIVGHPGIFDAHFSARKRGDSITYQPAGMPFSRDELEEAGASFHLTDAYYEFEPGMYFSGEISRPQDWQSSDPNLRLKRDNEYFLDPILDDVSLLLETDSGPVVVFGCAHAGVSTILDYLARKSGHTAFHAVIGGTHLMRANEQQIETALHTLERYQVEKIVTTHCTGFQAMARFYQHFDDRFHAAKVGDIFEF